jgi:hypothetical protein
MKYIKLFESKSKYKKGDIVICIRKDLRKTDNIPIPQYKKPYIINKIYKDSQANYLNILDPNTKQNLGSWNEEVFTSDTEISINKYNL